MRKSMGAPFDLNSATRRPRAAMAMDDSPPSRSCTRITLLEPGMWRFCLAKARMYSRPLSLPM